MLKVLAILLLVAYCVGRETSPRLWGSRVVTANSGPISLYLRGLSDLTPPTFYIIDTSDKEFGVEIVNGKCISKDDGSEWSSPCSYANGNTTIRVKDVFAQKVLRYPVLFDGLVFLFVYFAPNGQFYPPTTGGVVIKEMVPLSRFVLGQKTVSLTFAVEGSTSYAALSGDYGVSLCRWDGIKLTYQAAWANCSTGVGANGTDLFYDTKKNARIFTYNAPLENIKSKYVFYEWFAHKEWTTITIDKTQTEPPRLWGSRVVTARSGPVTLHFTGSSYLTPPTFYISDKLIGVEIVNGKCILKDDGSEWSSPCSYADGNTTIRVKDVLAQKDLRYPVLFDGLVYLMVYFAPGCQFYPPLAGEAVIKEMVPLSRFVLGQKTLSLTFAAEGSTSQASLKGDYGVGFCKWNGIKLTYQAAWANCSTGVGANGTDLFYDTKKNARIFTYNAPLENIKSKYVFYQWFGHKDWTTISIDTTQSGEDPIVAECPGVSS